MKLSILVVEGACNSGKSLSIRKAICELINSGAFCIEYNSKRYPMDKDFATRICEDAITKEGYTGQITVAGKIGDKTVCITTYGDSFKYDIYSALEMARKNYDRDIDIFVCAAHGKALEALNHLGECTLLKKDKEQDKSIFEIANCEFGNIIVDEINKMIN